MGNKVLNGGDKTQACCTTKATCAIAVCSAGFKKKANVDNLSCSGGRDSCSDTAMGGTCCEKDTSTCGGVVGITCPYGFYDERTLWNSKTPEEVKDAWNGRATTEKTKNADCCTPKAACFNEGTTTPSPWGEFAAPAAHEPAAHAPAAHAPAAHGPAHLRLYSEHRTAVA